MTRPWQRLFRVLPEETGKLGALALLAGLLQAGVSVGMTASDSLFLAHLGAAGLPLVYLGLPVVMLIYAPVYSLLLARVGIDRLIQFTLAAVVLGGVFFATAPAVLGETTPWLLYAMKLYSGLWFIALYTLFWNFADDYFSILDGKRLYGLIAAGGATGATLGAALVTGLSHVVAPYRLFFVWAVLALVAMPLIAVLRRAHPKIELEDPGPEPTSTRSLLRTVRETFKTSRFALALAASCFSAVALAAVLEYLAMGVLARGQSPGDLAHLLGELYAVANILTVVANVFVFNRLVGRIGVKNTTLVLPLAFLAAFSGLFLDQGFVAAILGFYAYQTLLASIEYNNVNLLFSALPTGTKRPLRTFVEAMSEPAATALAGGLLWVWGSTLGSAHVALAGLFASVGALVVASVLRHDYHDALTVTLRRDWLDFSPSPDHWRKNLAEADRALLREKARHSADRAERIAATDLLVYTADPGAGEALTELVASARPAEADQLRVAIDRILRGNDTATIAGLLLWLESDRCPEDPELLDEFTAGGALPLRQLPHWRRSRHPARIAMSAVARWHGPRVEDTAAAIAEIRTLLAGEPSSRRWAIRALGMFRHAPHARALLPFLDEPDAEIRLETLRALHRLATPDTEAVLARVLPMLAEAAPDERQLILGIAGKVSSVPAVSDLLQAAGQFSAAEARSLESLIVTLGPRAIATIIHVLRNPAAPLRARTIAGRALGRLAPPQLELIAGDLMITELRRAQELAAIARNLDADVRAAGCHGIEVLRRFYRDSASDGIGFVLQLLGLTGRLPDVDLIQASIRFASPKDRANAIESIEQSCPRAMFTLLQPLLATDEPPHGRSTQPPPPLETLLRRASSGEHPVECAAALLALHELGVAEGRELLLRRIDRTEPGHVTAMLAGLLPCFDPPGNGDAPRPLHLVQRLAALVRATYLAEASIGALDYLASRSTELHSSDGRTLYEPRQPTGDLLVVAAGAVDLVRPSGTTRLGPGATCNERTLMGTAVREEQAVSRGSTVLAIPSATVRRAIEIFPGLGLSLYRAKIVNGAVR